MTSNNIKNAPGFSKPKGFTPNSDNKAKHEADRPSESTAIPKARENAQALSFQSHDAMTALQHGVLQNAAVYVQQKQKERNALVDKVSDAIAYLSDPGLLEADIMSAAAAKVKQRTNAWGYESSSVNLDELFALPATSQRLIGEG